MSKRYSIITYGCQMNKSDSERIATVLENIGYKPASRISEADLIVVNMCSVRQSAVDRVYGKIKNFVNLKTQNSKLKTLLTGCLLKSDFNKLKGKVDYILPIKTLKLWPEFLKKGKYFYYPDPRNPEFNEKFNINYLKTKSKNSNKFSAFIPISNGCNNFCTYCVVPFTRGPLICRDHQEILKEVKEVVKKGYKEIWLLGQNVNDYQSPSDSKINFPKLLKMVNDIPGNFQIRFTSPHPKDFSDELIETVAKSEKVAKYLHLPVQSGDNEILKRMGRPYTIEQYKNLIKKIREKVPKINLSTDVIVGFPGETKKQFENTVKLFKEIEFNMAYIAKYSPRPGTAAAKLEDNVPHREKERRDRSLTEVLKQTALENNKKYIGKIVEVLVNNQKGEFLLGKTRTYKTVKLKGPENLIGQFVKAKIVNIFPWGLKGIIET